MGNRGISEVITMRTFIAFDIYPDERMLGAISDVKDYLKGESVRWVRMDSPACDTGLPRRYHQGVC